MRKEESIWEGELCGLEKYLHVVIFLRTQPIAGPWHAQEAEGSAETFPTSASQSLIALRRRSKTNDIFPMQLPKQLGFPKPPCASHKLPVSSADILDLDCALGSSGEV